MLGSNHSLKKSLPSQNTSQKNTISRHRVIAGKLSGIGQHTEIVMSRNVFSDRNFVVGAHQVVHAISSAKDSNEITVQSDLGK